MNRFISIAISIAFVIGVAGFVIFFKPNTPPATSQSTESAETTSYTNTDHGYSLSYPSTLSILEYTDDMAAIGTPIEGGIDSTAEIRTLVVEGEPGEAFADAAANDLSILCDADGPNTSFSCTGIDRIQAFLSTANVVGFEIYLKGEFRDLATNTVTNVEKGPYYVFAIATNATATKVLVIHTPLNKTATEANTAVIKAIAASVRTP